MCWRIGSTFLLLALGPLHGLVGQWGVTAEVGVARFGGTSQDTTGTSVRPYRPTTVGVRFDHDLGAVRVAIGFLYAKTGLAGERGDVAVVDYGALSLLEVAPEVGVRIARFGTGVVARLEAGPAADFWLLDGGDARTRLGARAALSFSWPVTSRLSGSVRASGALTNSMLNEDEIPPEAERRATRRGGVSIGLRYAL